MNVYDDSYIDYAVVEVGAGEQYFAKDYDRVHCKHGRYIGYPGGADYMCPECESGRDTPVDFPAVAIWLHFPIGEHEWDKTLFKTRYALSGLLEDSMLFNTAGDMSKKMADDDKRYPYVELEFYIEGDWMTEEEADEYDARDFFTHKGEELAQMLIEIASKWVLK